MFWSIFFGPEGLAATGRKDPISYETVSFFFFNFLRQKRSIEAKKDIQTFDIQDLNLLDKKKIAERWGKTRQDMSLQWNANKAPCSNLL